MLVKTKKFVFWFFSTIIIMYLTADLEMCVSTFTIDFHKLRQICRNHFQHNDSREKTHKIRSLVKQHIVHIR